MSFISTITTHFNRKLKTYNLGVSDTFEDARKKIINKCIELNLISYNYYCRFSFSCEDREDGKNEPLSQKEFVKMLYKKPLGEVLRVYGESHYVDDWNVSIFKLVQGEYKECNLNTGEQLEDSEDEDSD